MRWPDCGAELESDLANMVRIVSGCDQPADAVAFYAFGFRQLG
jgi:hypothetical protein